MIATGRALPVTAAEANAERLTVLLVTGMSGAGRATALKMLEDMGYEAVDNLPLSLLPPLVEARSRAAKPIAVGIDFRTRDFDAPRLCGEIDRLIGIGDLECRLVFLECDDEVLARRFTETRRRHPLAVDRPVADGIRLERMLMAPLRQRADTVIDTSALHLPDLRRLLAGDFALGDKPAFQLFLTSFAFREGLPREADLVFDVRFLDNPHYRDDLRHQTGLDAAVGAVVSADPAWPGFFAALTRLLGTLLPGYDREGKSYLTIAIGCTGGRHRSVFAAEQLAEWLRSAGHSVSLAHRDIEKSGGPRRAPGKSPREQLGINDAVVVEPGDRLPIRAAVFGEAHCSRESAGRRTLE